MWTDLEKKIEDWEKRFFEIKGEKSLEDREAGARDIDKNLELLKEEKERVQTRLRKIEELIAKTKALRDDLDEELCRELSGGYGLADVGKALKEKFGKQLKGGYDKGRRDMRNFLEQFYKIGKKQSRMLFSLLEEVDIIHYWVELPENVKNAPLLWHEGDAIFELGGSWEIKA